MGQQTATVHCQTLKLDVIVEGNIANSGMLICEAMDSRKFQNQASFHQRFIKNFSRWFMSLELKC